ncbi:MAG: oxidoreductase [Pseudomonadota bacterium]
MSHDDTCALITGGAQGLGLAIAEQLVSQGCRSLVLADVNAEAGQEAADAFGADGVASHFLHVDMADPEQAIAMVDQAQEMMGRVTSLVNCAATTDRGSILDTSIAAWDKIMDVNARGPFFALQRFAQLCIDGRHPGGCVNILSIVVHGGLPILAPYGASKAALLYTTKNSAAALAKHRVRVNGINVGWMDTPGEDVRQKVSHGRAPGWQAAVEAGLPFGMMVKPDHVARQAAFFLSEDSGVVTGAILDFDQTVVGAYPDTDAN